MSIESSVNTERNKSSTSFTVHQEQGTHQGNNFVLSVGDTEFGRLRIKTNRKTLDWNGIVDFDHLEDEFVESLSRSLFPQSQIAIFPEPHQEVYVSCGLSVVGNKRSKIHSFEFDLTNLKDRNSKKKLEDYREILRDSGSIVSARYDVSGHGFHYTIVGENSAHPEYHKGNRHLRLKLPISYDFTRESFTWMIEHHSANEQFTGVLDRESAAGILSSLK